MAIPPRLIRTVPSETPDHVEGYWKTATDLHPDWDHITFRDPIDPADFPLTSPHWAACANGAQRAGLIRLEALLRGGIYLDSDVEVYRPLDALLPLRGFAGWEDRNVVPDAVMGFEPDHPVLLDMISEAITRLPDGAWESGPGVSTRNLPGRSDVLLLPPGTFYPFHYSVKRNYDPNKVSGARRLAAIPAQQPWALACHRWAHSWKSSGTE